MCRKPGCYQPALTRLDTEINMKPSRILRSLSFRIPVRLSVSPAAVAPFPVRTQFDQLLTSELDALHDQLPAFGINATGYTNAAWIIDLLAASAATQKITQESLINVIAAQDSDRKLIDEYLDRSADMLDACNEVSEELEIIQRYIQSLRIVSHSVEANFEPNPATRARARHMLDSWFAIERSREMNSKYRVSKSRKLIQRFSHGTSIGGTTQLGEILTGSTAVASLVCGILGITLSFKSLKHMLPSMQLQSTNSWSFSLLGLQKKMTESSRGAGSTMLAELRQTIEASRNLRDCPAESDEIAVAVEELTRSCGELEERIKGLEGGVKELYKGLIGVRMALLDSLSKA